MPLSLRVFSVAARTLCGIMSARSVAAGVAMASVVNSTSSGRITGLFSALARRQEPIK